MVYDCVVSADRDVQYNLINNVVLCGGASSYDNMVDRLRYEVT
jgi:actin-related protein